jgi:hypothetical protein
MGTTPPNPGTGAGWWGGAALLGALLAGCSSPPPPALVQLPPPAVASEPPAPSSTPPRPAGTRPAPAQPYLGLRVGLFLPELPSRATLPPELSFLGALEIGARPDAAQILTAKRGGDLVMLLTNVGGVVIDVVEVPGVAGRLDLFAGCKGGGGFVDAALAPAGCPWDAPAVKAWTVVAGKLVAFGQPVRCTCYDR